MSADPAYQAWRGQRLFEAITQRTSRKQGGYAAWRVDQIADDILNRTRPVAQPNWAALGLGSADEAAGRN